MEYSPVYLKLKAVCTNNLYVGIRGRYEVRFSFLFVCEWWLYPRVEPGEMLQRHLR